MALFKKRDNPQDDKLEIAQKIAEQSKKIADRSEAIGVYFKRIFRWLSAWFDRILFNQKYARVVAFAFAILVYLTFNQDQTSSVVQAKTLSSVKVNAIYNREMYEVVGIPNTVEMDILGDYSDVILADSSEIKADLDLRMLSEGTHQVEFVPTGVSNRVRVNVKPSTVTVTIRIKETKTMSLSYEFINQEKMDPQYVLGNVTLDSRDVTISASKETLEEVAFVKALIDVSGKTSNFTKEAVIVAYNQKGELLENADVIPRVVTATVEVSSPNKTVPVRVQFDGEFADNKAVDVLELDHEAITIYGEQAVLDTISEIVVPVSTNGLTGGKYTHNITLPTGVKHSSVTKVTINVKLGDAITRTYDNISIIYRGNVNGYKIRTINEDDFNTSITVKGTEKALEGFNPDDVVVFINMRDAQPGNNQEMALYIEEHFSKLNIKANKESILVDIIQ